MSAQEDRALILVAEDEMMIAMLLEDLLESEGYRALLVSRVEKGLKLADLEPIAAAILDINLAGQESFPIAEALQRKNVPFLFSSGYGRGGLPEEYRDVQVLTKPFNLNEVVASLRRLLK